jgi:hypothetical protein
MTNCKIRAISYRLSAIGFALLAIVGCGYGRVSPTTYGYAKALYTLSNTQAADRIDEVANKIAVAAEAGEVTQREAGWLNDICDQCRSGDWAGAQQAAKRMMRDQIKR